LKVTSLFHFMGKKSNRVKSGPAVNSIFLPFIIALSLSAFPAFAAPVPGGVALLSPSDRSFVETDLVTLVVRMDDKVINDVKVTLNGKEQDSAGNPVGSFHIAFDEVRLSPGMNSVIITGYKDGKRVNEKDCLLFFRSNLDPSASTPPSGFARYWFHTDSNEKECTPCHRLDFTATAENPAEPVKSPCRACHGKVMANYRFVHGPAAVWSCTTCHETRGSGRKLSVRQPDEKVCLSCHENDWSKKKYPHGPTAAGNCTACHNPHASNENNFLRLNTADLCVACHDDIASKPHVISGFSGVAGHPVRKSPDPFNPGREFTCASCHNPHASDFPLMLSGDHTSMFVYCQSCHKM
jgi:predicted CXXCH cytochrome family protein